MIDKKKKNFENCLEL